MELIFALIIFVTGVAIGTSLPIWIGIVIVIVGVYITMQTDGYGVVIPYIFTLVITVGLVVGNISYSVQSGYFDNISNPFVVKKVEKVKQ